MTFLSDRCPMIGQPPWTPDIPKKGSNKWSVNAVYIFVFVEVLVFFELRCNLTMDCYLSTHDQLSWQFKKSGFGSLAPVFFSEVSYFIKINWAHSKSNKIKRLSSRLIYFVPIVKVFGNLGFVEYTSDDFSWCQFDFNCLPLNLLPSKFGVLWNGNSPIRN